MEKYIVIAVILNSIVQPICGLTRIVENEADTGPGSLRSAIQMADPGDRIVLPSLRGKTIRLTSGDLVVDKDLMIQGPPGRDLVTISGEGLSRVFTVTGAAQVLLGNLRIVNGNGIGHGESGAGGGVYTDIPRLTLIGVQISNNHAQPGFSGGGVRIRSGIVSVNQSEISANFVEDVQGAEVGGDGGGISMEGVQIHLGFLDSLLDSNYTGVNGHGGGIAVRAFGGSPDSVSAFFSNADINQNTAGAGGGGVENVRGKIDILYCEIAANATLYHNGGGIENRNGDLLLRSSYIAGNQAGGSGGGIENFNASVLSVDNCTVDGNVAHGGGEDPGFGGGIDEVTTESPKLRVSFAITHCTIANNSGLENGKLTGIGGIAVRGGERVMSSTIVSHNFPVNFGAEDGGKLFSGGYNLSDDDSFGVLLSQTGDLNNVPARLTEFPEANGGPTPTLRLLSGSPAIDAGESDNTSTSAFDQRGPGYARVSNGRMDIGAFEVQIPGELLSRILAARNQRAGGNDPRDLDGDVRITVLDARRLITILADQPQSQ